MHAFSKDLLVMTGSVLNQAEGCLPILSAGRVHCRAYNAHGLMVYKKECYHDTTDSIHFMMVSNHRIVFCYSTLIRMSHKVQQPGSHTLIRYRKMNQDGGSCLKMTLGWCQILNYLESNFLRLTCQSLGKIFLLILVTEVDDCSCSCGVVGANTKAYMLFSTLKILKQKSCTSSKSQEPLSSFSTGSRNPWGLSMSGERLRNKVGICGRRNFVYQRAEEMENDKPFSHTLSDSSRISSCLKSRIELSACSSRKRQTYYFYCQAKW